MVVDSLRKSGAVKSGSFTLSSGEGSDTYIDVKAAVVSSPKLLLELAAAINSRLTARKMAGMGLGSVPLMSAVAALTGTPYVVVRKEEQGHGIKDRVIGSVTTGERVDIVEDVVTSGASAIEVARVLRSRGAAVDTVICVVDREESGRGNLARHGLKLSPITTKSALLRKG